MTEFCGGILVIKRVIKKRHIQAGDLLSLFANTAVAVNSTSPTSTPSVPVPSASVSTSSSSTEIQGVSNLVSSGANGPVVTTGLPANPTSFVGFTITEM
jgi:hypothetical protein